MRLPISIRGRASVRLSIPYYFWTTKLAVFEGGEISNDQQQQQNDNNKNKATTTSMTTSTTTIKTTTTTMTTTIHEWRLSSGVSQIPKVTLIEIITESYMLAPHRSLIRLPARSGPLTHSLACSLQTLICSPALSTAHSFARSAPLTHDHGNLRPVFFPINSIQSMSIQLISILQ